MQTRVHVLIDARAPIASGHGLCMPSAELNLKTNHRSLKLTETELRSKL